MYLFQYLLSLALCSLLQSARQNRRKGVAHESAAFNIHVDIDYSSDLFLQQQDSVIHLFKKNYLTVKFSKTRKTFIFRAFKFRRHIHFGTKGKSSMYIFAV